MKKNLKRILSYILAVALLIGLCPGLEKGTTVKAATSSVKLANLGSLGSLTVGSKTKSGKWWKMEVGGQVAFCMNLGYTCHSGDAYEDSSATYTSSSAGKNGKKACIGYWYTEKMKRSNKAYIMAQALFWAVEEGDTTEAKLKAVISKIKSNTGYFSSKTANELYEQIFEPSGTVTTTVKEYKYKGSGSHRQELLVVEGGIVPTYKKVVQNIYYRQRIRIKKVNEDNNPMTGAKFKIEADNIDELYSYSLNGDSSATDEDMNDFTVNAVTGSDGWISLRLTYHIYSDEYYYVPDSELESLDADGKAAVKADMDDNGFNYASDLTKDGAEIKVAQDIMSQYDKVKNQYQITETDSGNNNIVINSVYKNGKTFSLDDNYIWTNVDQVGGPTKEWSAVEEKPYDINITDNYKKVGLKIVKSDDYSSDKKAHGDASLDGAVFGIYDDANCTVNSTFYNTDGSKNQNNQFTTKNASFETPYLRCGKSYYIKELKAPVGYKLKTDVKKITLDGGQYPNDVEYITTKENVTIDNHPILGKVALQKFYSDGKTGVIHPEIGAVFQVYLKDKEKSGGYSACDEYERALLTIDENGYACSRELYYGDYIIHQVSSGEQDTERVKDIPVKIDNPDRVETKTFSMNNNLFKAYLRIIKKDGNTEKTVLKAGTSYQIYQVDQNGKETLVTQEYSDGHKKTLVDTFSTDETGQIMTVEALKSGKYRIYETDAATGYHISTSYIEVDINSQADNYTSETDKDGATYSTVTLEYTNYEAYGKLSILKKGEQLKDFKDGKFEYSETQLNGVTFEIYAAEDIATQDNQGTNWFEKGDLVGTVTTGKDASFTSECGGITGYETDEDGIVTVNLPLGKYRVTEKKTLYGYILPDHDWNVEFTWNNHEDEYVLNSTDATDNKGVMNALNERAKAKLSLQKSDADRQTGISGVVFGVYTKDNIYNAEGEKIVDAGTRLGGLVTDSQGAAVSDLDLPLMDEKYNEKTESVSGSAVTVSGSAVTAEEIKLNSGNYYLKEEIVSGSYYLTDEEMPVHLEYKDMQTAIIGKHVTKTNEQTEVEIDKTSATSGEEVPGCQLVISDQKGTEIIRWTSGNKDSVVTNSFLKQLGYQNVTAEVDDKGNLIVRGLLHDTEYVLTEIRPADGYVTADSISFMLRKDVAGQNGTVVSLKQADGSFVDKTDHVVSMIDEITKVKFTKKNEDGKLLGGAKIAVYDSKGNKVTEFTTKQGKAYNLEGLLIVGETYTFKEVKAPDGYDVAKEVKYTIKDTKELQNVSMVDKKMGTIRTKTPGNFSEGSNSSPETGYLKLLLLLISILMVAGGTGLYAWRRSYGKKKIQ